MPGTITSTLFVKILDGSLLLQGVPIEFLKGLLLQTFFMDESMESSI